ncbi:Hsp70 family protein [Vulgatibacter incomptus]|uniref:Chaperone protein DnaK n=1 Tax=Vulgatibacter incomptus TaxID=1391653 RepID=A0A0K1PD19_9BACT|nr:Hsp70 family protein [Vulgatibacter incomptus]AKU91415.1 Chaperone protein DnaK [Vulgatibacter incomptus]
MASVRKARYVVGIDLGTTHSAMGFSPIGKKAIEIFRVPQLVAPGEVAELPLLPSTVYLPAEGELPAGATRLPWGDEPPYVVGELARRLGSKVPGRLVASAKSWLSNAGVDRTAAILPWGAPDDVPRLSPVEASARILAHMRAAWDAAHPANPLAAQEVILTVPASFDEVARELTVEATRRAGLPRARLLEEPQAAFYDFILQHEEGLADAIGDARLALVVDVGGGTTDLTLVQLSPRPSGPPALERIAVGDHLVLGGDNMDVTLARHVEAKLGAKLDAAQWSALVQASRQAKEALLSGQGPAEYGISVLGRGTKLLGGGLSYKLEASEAAGILLDGFLPKTARDELPARKGRVALTELGLPFASDPGISRHVNAFLRRHAQAAAMTGARMADGLPRPDVLLLNGGVFNAPAVTKRLGEVFEGWFPGDPVPLLSHASLDLAVARGATYYGLVRRGLGVRIAGGSPRAYFVAVEGKGGHRAALCVAPRGMEEGSALEVESRTFELVVGQPVTFPLYSSSADRSDAVGDVVDLDDELEPLPPLHTVLRVGEAEAGAKPAAGRERTEAVRLGSGLTEIGTLELSLRTVEPPERRWRLEFSLRGEGGGAAVAPIDQLPKRFEEARDLVERVFGKTAQAVDAKEIKNVWRSLEKILGARDGWSSAVNRELWGVVFGGAQKRRRSADHERVWFQLAGFCLRPGFGAPLDRWRASELWKIFQQGVQYTTEKANWSEWWILWRRVAGGLDEGEQRQILEWVRPWLKPPEGRFPAKPRGPKAEGLDEMVRLLVSLERLPASDKVEAGRWILHRMEGGRASWWPLGRLGARQPFYGSAHDVVPQQTASDWVERLLPLDWKKAEGASFAAAQLARATGDRSRDLSEELRGKVASKLAAAGAPEGWSRMVREVTELDVQDEMRVFGDTLPAGLRLIPSAA